MYITFVVISRPQESHNCVIAQTWREIEELFSYLKFDPDTRSVVLYSTQADFVGSLDGDEISSGIIAPLRNKKLDAGRDERL
uniref:BLUF domain-containing protein n=1 Tax=Steinernema glaseri TaxID=37863 RepID=A0A1I7ZWK8_9BILA